jgi:hypothetical protein
MLRILFFQLETIVTNQFCVWIRPVHHVRVISQRHRRLCQSPSVQRLDRSCLELGREMKPKFVFVHRDESAWAMGDLAYDLDDTIETGVVKARQNGICPGSDGYAAFMTAFSRRVRSRQLSDKREVEVA